MMVVRTRFEKTLAAASFVVAAALAFTSLLLSPTHDIAAGVLMACAQFLLLTASILHIDYKLNIYGHSKSHNETSQRNQEQQPIEHSQES